MGKLGVNFSTLGLLALLHFLLLAISPVVHCANILFFFGVSTYSHRLLITPFANSLSTLGHNITILSPYNSSTPTPTSNSSSPIHEFSPPALQNFFISAFGPHSDFLSIRLAGKQQDAWHEMLPHLATTVCDIILTSPESQEWISSSHFDLVIIDALFNDCGLGLAWKFKAPHIIFGTCTLFMWQSDSYGFSPEESWIPDPSGNFPMEMNFLQRVENTVRPILWHLYRSYVMYPKLEKGFHRAFNTNAEEMPPLRELEKGASLILQNMHYSLDYPRAVSPLVVPVGGIHLTKPKLGEKGVDSQLPKEMKSFLDSSDGFIYVSFGSVVQISKMPLEMRRTFVTTFGKYLGKLKFLWKFELNPTNTITVDSNSDLPENILAGNWMPQQEILKHPKIRGFITHGGILSIEEAVANGVPMLVMPVFADQEFNSENIVRSGMGLQLHFKNVSESKLSEAIDELITNNRYKETVVEVSKIFLDRPMAPLDEAIWWVEHVLKYPTSGKYRHSWSTQQSWMVRRSLDVWAFLALIALIFALFFLALALSILNFSYKVCRSLTGQTRGEIQIEVIQDTPTSTPSPNSKENNNRLSFGKYQSDSPSPILALEKKKHK